MEGLARMARDPALRPDFAVFRTMVYYIDAFPERMHHPKEDAHLFARLQQALLEYEQTWPIGIERFRALVEAYAKFHWDHMRREEKELIPLAEKALAPAPVGLGERWKAAAGVS